MLTKPTCSNVCDRRIHCCMQTILSSITRTIETLVSRSPMPAYSAQAPPWRPSPRQGVRSAGRPATPPSAPTHPIRISRGIASPTPSIPSGLRSCSPPPSSHGSASEAWPCSRPQACHHSAGRRRRPPCEQKPGALISSSGAGSFSRGDENPRSKLGRRKKRLPCCVDRWCRG